MLEIERELDEKLSEILNEPECQIYDEFYSLHTGNVDSGNIVYTMAPLKSEWYHNKMNDEHFGYKLNEEKYTDFKAGCKTAGYNVDKDFLYVNAIPFIAKGFSSFSKETKQNLEWIGYSIFEKLEPRFIIIIGYETAEHLTGMTYIEFTERLGKPFEIESGAKVVLFNEHNFGALSKLYYKNYHIERKN